jgi:hypothetical protein
LCGRNPIWREALELFPDDKELPVLLEQDDKALNAFLTAHFEPGKRVDTNVRATWEEEKLQVSLEQDGKASHTLPSSYFEPGRGVDTNVGEISGRAH